MTVYDNVREFHRKLDLPYHGDGSPPALLDHDVMLFRAGFMMEELVELVQAHARGDLAGCVDALCDIEYIASGTAHMLRVDLDAHHAEVQKANLTKVRADGVDDPRSKRSHYLNVVKPIGFQPPDHTPILERSGYVKK